MKLFRIVQFFVGVALLIGAWLWQPLSFFTAYLVSFVFWVGIPVGAVLLLCLDGLIDGDWLELFRPFLKRWAKVLPVFALLIIPVLFGIPWLFRWFSEREYLQPFQAWYLQTHFFVLRSILYVLLWTVCARVVSRRRSGRVSAVVLILLSLTVTLASADWLISLDPKWKSTAFGLIVLVGQSLTALSICLTEIFRSERFRRGLTQITEKTVRDASNVLLVHVLLWAYLFFMQYLIVWSGNIADEAHWYVVHGRGHWGAFAGFILLFKFFIPFMLLLFRTLKTRPAVLSIIASVILAAHWAENAWLVLPVFNMSMDMALPKLWVNAWVMLGMGFIIYSLVAGLPSPMARVIETEVSGE